MALNTVSSDRLSTNVKTSNLGTELSKKVGQSKNLILNGAFLISQRGVSSTTSGYGTVDRFKVQYSGADEAPTQAQADIASGTTPYTSGFRKALKITNGNQTGGAGSNDFIRLSTFLEGQDIANSGWNYLSSSSFITLSFWVKSSVAQNFYGFIRNTDGTAQQYQFETGSLTADTWTKITKTIPGNSNLNFANDTGGAFELYIHQFAGTDQTASGVTLNAWATYSGSAKMPDFTSTWYTTNDATFEITGVQLELGQTATDFEHRSVTHELQLCKRYYQLWVDGSNQFVCFGDMYTATQCDGGVQLPVEMRATPTIEANTGNDYYIIYTNAGDSHIDGTLTSFRTHKKAVLWYAALDDSGQTAGHANRWVTASASAKIAFSAEL